MTLPYRADTIGSFLRPAELTAARTNGANPERVRAIEDEHILRLLAKQKELGFEIFTDGELRRRNFMSDFTDAVGGFDPSGEIARDWDATEGKPKVSAVTGVVNDKLRQLRPLTAHELSFLKANSPGDIKMQVPSATQFPAIAFKRGITDGIYEDHCALLREIVEIMKRDFATPAWDGVKYIQFDAPRYSYYLDPKWREWIKTEMNQYPEAARKPGVTLGIHLCRGNNRGHWYAEGGYDAIAEKVFGELKADRFLLEYDDERSGTFAPLRLVPKDKIVVLGIVSTKKAELETVDDVARRIDEAAKYFPLENLTLSPQCGFASTAEGNLLTEDEQWAKLKLVVDTVRQVWGDR
jgi:5-methyltetrahydropteroyltriglutamate--homocysteine methyltransferase